MTSMIGEPGMPGPTCATHPERAAVALCVRCRRMVCAECSTRFAGINHCSGCVAALGKTRPGTRPASGPAALSQVVAAYGSLALVLYALASLVAP